jgi:hypothetical protein
MLNQISGNQQAPRTPRFPIGSARARCTCCRRARASAAPSAARASSFTGFTLSGQYLVNLGPFTNLQMYDAVLQTWRNVTPANGVPVTISGDGTNYRLANTTGAAVARS